MPSWGIRYLPEFQENYFVSENYCYSNYYSEMSGEGYTEVPPTSVWSACRGGRHRVWVLENCQVA